MSGHLPFSVEYAKTGRSKCKGCKNPVEKDSLRIAKIIQSPFHDGVMPTWFHHTCFFIKNHPTSVTEIENFDNIRWEDQETLKTQIDSPTLSAPSPSSKTSKNPLKRPQSLRPDFSIEYAPSNRSKCVGCETHIPKGVIRVGKLDTESKMGARYQGVLRWHHLECFGDLRESLKFFSSGETLSGFENLSAEDQELVKSKIPVTDSPDAPPPPKKSKPTPLNIEEEEKMKQQNKELFQLRDELQTLEKYQLNDLFEFNNQYQPKGQAEILNALSDSLLFGALKPCKKCGGGFQFVSGIGYRCTGDLTEWTKCEEVTQDPERTEFKIPDHMREEIPFLAGYESKVQRRLLRITAPSTSSGVKSEGGSSGPQVNRGPLPLKGMQFFIAGRTSKSREELRKEIMQLGGLVVSKVHENLAAVIADDKALEKGGKTFETAQLHEIQVVTEDFVDEAKDYKDTPVSLLTKKNIAPWGGDPTKRIAVTMDKSTSQGKSGYGKKSSGKVTLKVKGGGAVDPASGLEDVAHIYQDGDNKYAVTLGLTSIQSAKNSYYKLQVLKHDVRGEYWLFRSWGRIGTTIGGTKCDSMPLYNALSKFREHYFDKSGNRWENRKNFVKSPGKMCPIDIDEGDESSNNESLQADVESKLKKPVQDLIKLIFDVNLMKKVMMEFELDTEKMPLGKLSKKQLQAAYGVLKEAQELLASGNTDRLLLVDASNRFYTLVPHSFGVGEPPILDNEILIKSKCEMLDSLIEMEIAYNLLNVESESDKSPLDAHYEKLHTEIDVLDKDSKEFKIIEEYTRNTHSATHSYYELEIEDVFVVKREGEDKRYKPFRKLNNRKLLWHGSRTTNYAGILSQGLRIAPPEAPVTGYMFGKGIYFADMVSKSANYCCTNTQNPTGLLLLCDVALGNMYERLHADYIEKLPKGKHSTLGVGRTHPDPKKVYKTEDGVEVPYGKGVKSKYHQKCCLLHNEYIVYDVKQVNVKYLVRMKFKYGK